MGGREVRGPRDRRHVEGLAVAGVDEILRAEQVPGGRNWLLHRLEYAVRSREDSAAPPRLGLMPEARGGRRPDGVLTVRMRALIERGLGAVRTCGPDGSPV